MFGLNNLETKFMSKYKVKEPITVDGVEQAVDAEVELTDDQAKEFEGKVEAVQADAGAGEGSGGGGAGE